MMPVLSNILFRLATTEMYFFKNANVCSRNMDEAKVTFVEDMKFMKFNLKYVSCRSDFCPGCNTHSSGSISDLSIICRTTTSTQKPRKAL